jgi:hypothetical protein
MIGKPYSGKPNVRFDEGELEIELLATTPALYSTGSDKRVSYLFLPLNSTLPQSLQIVYIISANA